MVSQIRSNKSHLVPFERKLIVTTLIASLFLHIVALALTQLEYDPYPKPFAAIDVTFIESPPTKILKTQIVNEPDSESNDSKNQAIYQSEKSHSTDKEQIRRGDEGGVPGVKGIPQNQSQPSKPTNNTRNSNQSKPVNMTKPAANVATKHPHKIESLRLDEKTLIAKFGSSAQAPDPNPRETQKSASLSGYRAFSRAAGSGAAFIGSGGSADYIPNLPDGDVTLLNTKASQHAVFVRRVATKIFAEIRSAGWESVSGGDIDAISEFTTVEGQMDLKGHAISVVLKESCGSKRFDALIIDAVKKGLFDQNPPKVAALEDGNIHFIFKSRSWSRRATDRRGAPYERRWLLLATGLL